MTNPSFLTTPQNRKIAYHQLAGQGGAAQTGIIFLGGFMSDMEGTKAVHLEQWATRTGRPFLRFDYSGHGQSSENFTDGCIGDWAEDAIAAISMLTTGPQILVGSSMGGWMSLLACRALPDRVAGLVTIAAAPDFTQDSMWAGFDDDQRAALLRDGQILLPSDYDAPYTITRRLIENGRENLVLREDMPLPFPVRFLQGTADTDVDMSVALRLLERADGPDIRLTMVKGADHRFSDDGALALIVTSVEEVLNSIGGA